MNRRQMLAAIGGGVASQLAAQTTKRRNVIYTPFFWRYIMLIIRSIPEPIFKKMKI